jgi:hypothetical protein
LPFDNSLFIGDYPVLLTEQLGFPVILRIFHKDIETITKKQVEQTGSGRQPYLTPARFFSYPVASLQSNYIAGVCNAEKNRSVYDKRVEGTLRTPQQNENNPYERPVQ